jgi:hypothetical protein
MKADKQRHSKELEQLQSELRKQTDSELERLRHYHQSEIDIMIRRREVYQRIAMAMRVFLSGSARASEDEKREFLKAYDLCYLWATDEVLAALGEFLDLNVTNTANPSPENQPRLQSSYGRCMTEMRKDAGFPGTSVDRGAYRIVNF